MNFSKRRGESRPSGRKRPRRSVGTRGGCGDGWGPCACPREWRFRQGFMLTRWISSPGRGQAPDLFPHCSSEEVIELRKECETKGERDAGMECGDVAKDVGAGDLWRGEAGR